MAEADCMTGAEDETAPGTPEHDDNTTTGAKVYEKGTPEHAAYVKDVLGDFAPDPEPAEKTTLHFIGVYGPRLTAMGITALPAVPPDAEIGGDRDGPYPPTVKQIARFNKSRGKVPGTHGPAGWAMRQNWTKATVATAEELAEWAAYPGAPGVCIPLCKLLPDGTYLVFADGDIRDLAVAKEIDDLLVATLGAAPIRIGNAPKFGRVYRCTEAVTKTMTAWYRLPGDAADDTDGHRVEILGDGQQFVGYGIHPKIRKPYTWTEGDLTEYRLDQIPLVTPDQIKAFLDAADAVLSRHGLVIDAKKAQSSGTGNWQPPTDEELARLPIGDRICAMALARLAEWVPVAFPAAVYRGASGWRVSSDDLCRNLEEALAFHPRGIKDWGEDVRYSPIGVLRTFCRFADDGVIEMRDDFDDDKGMTDAEAYRWLGAMLGIDYDAENISAEDDFPKVDAEAAEGPSANAKSADEDWEEWINDAPADDPADAEPTAKDHPWAGWGVVEINANVARLAKLRREDPATYTLLKGWWASVRDFPASTLESMLDIHAAAVAMSHDDRTPWTPGEIAAAHLWDRDTIGRNLGRLARLRRESPDAFAALIVEWEERVKLLPGALTSVLNQIDAKRQTGHHMPHPTSPRPGLGKTAFPPRRQRVLGNRFLAKTGTVGIAQPAAGKSTFSLLSAVAIAMNIPLTGEEVHRTGPVWYHDNEDDHDEIERRVAAICIEYGINADDLAGKLFISGAEEKNLVLATKGTDKSSAVMPTPAVAEMIGFITAHGIVHVAIGPLVSLKSGIDSNSNDEMDEVVKIARSVALATGCSLDITHHAVKNHTGNTESRAGDMNASRGATAILAAARGGYTLSMMSTTTAKNLGIDSGLAGRLVRLDSAKNNYSAGGKGEKWFEFRSVQLDNGEMPADADALFTAIPGDSVGVLVPWNGAATDAAAEERDDAKHQALVQAIAEAMTSNRAALKEILPVIGKHADVQERKARSLIAVALENGAAAVVNGKPCTLYLEGDKNKPKTVVRTWDAEDEEAA